MANDLGRYLAYSHLATIVTALGSILFALQLLRTRRTPQSILAWLLALVFLPAIAIPSYLLFGTRKVVLRRARTARRDAELPALNRPIERVLYGSGIAPARAGNGFRLIEDGQLAFAELLALIRAAQSRIHMTMFILGDDRTGHALLDALAARARAGVEVRVILDRVGSAKVLPRAQRSLRAAGGRVRPFTQFLQAALRGRANLRNHRKLTIFDGTHVFMGGMNVAEEYMGEHAFPGRFRDIAATASGPIAREAERLFAADWQFCGGDALASADRGAVLGASFGDAELQLVPSGPDLADDALYDAMLSAFGQARSRIAIVTPYYVPDDTLHKALELAARRGVRTQLIMPQRSNHALADFARRALLVELAAAGVELHAFTAGMLHAKAALVDDDFAYVGSANLDMRSLYLNYEDAVFIYDRPHVERVATWISNLLLECKRDAFTLNRAVWPIEQLARLLAPEL